MVLKNFENRRWRWSRMLKGLFTRADRLFCADGPVPLSEALCVSGRIAQLGARANALLQEAKENDTSPRTQEHLRTQALLLEAYSKAMIKLAREHHLPEDVLPLYVMDDGGEVICDPLARLDSMFDRETNNERP